MNQIVVNLIYIPYVLCLEFHIPNPDVTVETWDFFEGQVTSPNSMTQGLPKENLLAWNYQKREKMGSVCWCPSCLPKLYEFQLHPFHQRLNMERKGERLKYKPQDLGIDSWIKCLSYMHED